MVSTDISSIGDGIPTGAAASSRKTSVINFSEVKGLRRWLIGLDIGGGLVAWTAVVLYAGHRTRRVQARRGDPDGYLPVADHRRPAGAAPPVSGSGLCGALGRAQPPRSFDSLVRLGGGLAQPGGTRRTIPHR